MMRNIFFILVIIHYNCYSQKYFLLDDLKKFKVKEYTFDTRELYGFNKKINAYNVFITKDNILLLSVLPELDNLSIFDNKNIEQNWTEINLESVKELIFTKAELISMVADWSIENSPTKKSLNYKLIKKEKGKYYVSKYCLTELFKVAKIEFPLISSYGVINIKDTKVSIEQMQTAFREQFPNKNFILDIRNNEFLRDLDISYNYRNYLSKEFSIKNYHAYQFWTLDGWWSQDGYNEHRGIDRFLYIPLEGIVGGSYDFYFRLKPKISSNDYKASSIEKLWDNIIHERIMIAEELK